ncbi:hypothetical protein R6U77_18340 [Lysinibacillus louembei]|uniref:Uncharacterized protein n=1 Tax=Lysinibacillus louembei TaxID=1470088 RepID=A0ABZ0RY11_9BACI|nr:hypothetical protein [Lysinibacillus louembei]WPK11828.1 hypothetical protein R6U77_18340 [Lysinibacillus louembei]
MLNFLIEYWTLLIFLFVGFLLVLLVIFKLPMSLQEKLYEKIVEWLVYACIEAEKALGQGTGQVKLRYVYNLFIQRFPYLRYFISFETFTSLVAEALITVTKLLENNEDVMFYVYGTYLNDREMD